MKRIVGVIFLVALLTGCGTGFLYRQLDWLVPWYVSDFISLNDAQSGDLERRLAQQLEWHCLTQLPQYAAFLRQVAGSVSRPSPPVNRAEVAAAYDTVNAFAATLVDRLAPEAAAVLASASDEQIAEFFDRLESQNRRYEKKFVAGPAADRVASRSERMVKRLEKWVGPLMPAQKHAVDRWSAAVDGTGKEWIAYRRRIQTAFEALLRGRRGAPDFAAAVTALATQRHRYHSPAYAAMRERRREDTIDMLTGLAASLSPAQKGHFSDKVSALADDFEALSCPPPESARPLSGST